jgi:hypothetical protein
MSTETDRLFKSLSHLREMLAAAIDETKEAAVFADDLGGEFMQELGTDLADLQVSLRDLLNTLDDSIAEGKTLRDDLKAMETSLRIPIDDEENYKVDSERIQDEIKEEEVEKEEEEEEKKGWL